ncbi:hypothetical protein OL239_02545 [Arthrobacter sp. ATA002]|nr:hypothetical protein [Arthrobacter sp. ATA002]WAP52204.1 hypothetical protein OL239_02545 [Arthrobacter sp. ATA002]
MKPLGEKGPRVTFAETTQPDLRFEVREHVNEALARVTRPEHQDDPINRDASGDEGHHLRGCLVEPVSIIEYAQQRPFLCDIGQQIERRQPDEKTIRCRPSAEPQRHPERSLLGLGEHDGPVEQRRT